MDSHVKLIEANKGETAKRNKSVDHLALVICKLWAMSSYCNYLDNNFSPQSMKQKVDLELKKINK